MMVALEQPYFPSVDSSLCSGMERSMVENLYAINHSVTGTDRGLWPLSMVFYGIFGVTFSRI